MTANDRDRLDLYRRLDEVLGTEEANTLMEHLPPVPWNEVATKSDVTASEVAVRTDLEAASSRLRSEMQTMGKELCREMQAMGTELRSEMQAMRFELRAEMLSGFNRQIKWLVTFGMAWSSLLIAVSRFAS
jgi:hypothetical protein